ncbi:MAG: hypothetical protein AVDCRST_MAG53-1833, partial [uncultured Solirubrobacteraceae bacterium]
CPSSSAASSPRCWPSGSPPRPAPKCRSRCFLSCSRRSPCPASRSCRPGSSRAPAFRTSPRRRPWPGCRRPPRRCARCPPRSAASGSAAPGRTACA